MKKMFSAALISASTLFFACNDNNDNNKDAAMDVATIDHTTTSAGTNTTPDNTASVNKDLSSASTSANTGSVNNNNANNNSTNNTTVSKAVTDKNIVNFVQKAASGGMMEVQLGTYAAQNAQNQRVKDFGNMIMTDHTNANNELKNMASSNSIQIPAALTSMHKSHVDMLTSKKGASFDKAYIDMMVTDHKKDIDDFRKASKNLTEQSYKGFAGKTLPVLQKHLDSAIAIQKSMK